MRRGALLAIGAVLSGGCSAVRSHYVQAGYSAVSPGAIKRLAVVGWAPTPELASLLAAVATDRLKLKSNYLISRTGAARSWSDACEQREGVLALRALAASQSNGNASLQVAAELYACATGALVWRAEGSNTHASDDADLQELANNYVLKLGDGVRAWAGPAFVLLRELLDVLPNPTLSDEELLEKIELD